MQRLRGVLRSPSLSTPARVALTGGGGCPALSPLPPPPPSLGRLWCKQLSLDSQAAGPGRRPAPYGSCGLRAKRLGWEGRFPQPVYRDPRPLSPVPICCLPLSPWGQPLVPSSGLPPLTSCQWPSVTGIRMLNSASACVCVCVCVRCAHTPEPAPGGVPASPGCHKSSPSPPQACPVSSQCTGEWQIGISRRPGKGLSWGPPWRVLRGQTKAGRMSVPQPFLASSCTGTQGPPWSELLTRLLDSTLPQGRGVGGSQSVCPLLSLIQLGLLWARASLGIQDTPEAEGISALSHNLRAMGRDDTDTPEGRPSPCPAGAGARGASWKKGPLS
ncbi:uncharacterized protein LOC101081589 isoform X3 [Felis catus]|uniref:uncharacterized protein LOC101081589 isoform X3 n=1 Tax=Felis catus TaxID=9685 RepID=UPI001D19FADB|nr:uncharacterized protein LOC101081589 isoform X3 [Felis catus]